MLSLTHQALQKFDNSHDFERLAADVLNSLGYRDVVPIAPKGGSDGGKDITYRTYDNENALACVSLREDARAKILSDLAKHSKGTYREYTFFSNQYLTAAEKQEVEKYCMDELEATFVSKDIEALRSLLDTALKDLRKKYLYIEVNDTPQYELKVVNVRSYSLESKIEKAQKRLEKTKMAEKERINDPFNLRLMSSSILGKSESEMVSVISNYLKQLENKNARVKKLLSFNIELESNAADTHVEVVTIPDDGVNISFRPKDYFPVEPTYGNINSFLLTSNHLAAKHDGNEFFAKFYKDKTSIQSNLEKLNPSHPKLIFDEVVYILSDDMGETYNFQVKIYSTKLKEPLLTNIVIARADAVETQG